MSWTKDVVLERLIDAYKTIEATTKRPSPATPGRGSPMFVRDQNDRMMAGGAAQLRDEEAMRHAQDRRPVASYSISMALEAQRWPLEFIKDEQKRECLIEYATCRARDGDWSAYLHRRNRRVGSQNAWLRRKTYRWNEQSLQRIAHALLKSSVPLRLAGDGQVTHEQAETSCELATVGLRAWRSADAKPRHMPEMLIPPSRDIQSR